MGFYVRCVYKRRLQNVDKRSAEFKLNGVLLKAGKCTFHVKIYKIMDSGNRFLEKQNVFNFSMFILLNQIRI